MGLEEGRAARAVRDALGKTKGSAGGLVGLPALRLAPAGAREGDTLLGIWNYSKWSAPTGIWGQTRWGCCMWGVEENATAQWGPDPAYGMWGISLWGWTLFYDEPLNNFELGRWGLSRWGRALWNEE